MAKWGSWSFTATALTFQCILLILYGATGVQYASNTGASESIRYGSYIDVAVMIFVGFGLLMVPVVSPLVSMCATFFLTVFVMQWGMLVTEFWLGVVKNDGVFHPVKLEMKLLIDGLFQAASVMITLGAVIGKMTPTQLLWLAAIHVIGLGLNFHICVAKLGISDTGGSLLVHLFGAMAGITASWAFAMVNEKAHPATLKKVGAGPKPPTSSQEIFSLIGTVFLWICWPSFVSGVVDGPQQHRAIVNTIIALTASTFVAFATSCWFRGGKWSAADIQNATLAAGVAIGVPGDLILTPAGAMAIGMISGAASVAGFTWCQKWLEENCSIHDTAGVFWLHGITGIISGVSGAIAGSTVTRSEYGATSLYTIYARMAPSNVTLASELGVTAGEDRTAMRQAGMQFAAVLVTLGISTVTGVVIGLITGSPLFYQMPTEDMFKDEIFFGEAEAEESHSNEPDEGAKKDAGNATEMTVVSATDDKK